MRSDRRILWAFALGLVGLLASAVPGAASRGPTVAIVTSSRVGPFETASRAMADTLREGPRQPEVLTFDLEGERDKAPGVLTAVRDARPDLIVTVGSLATAVVLADATLRTPVVFSMVLYPRQSEFLNDPSRVTGVALDVPVEVQLQYVRRLVPGARRLGVLYHAAETGLVVEAARRAAPAQGLTLVAHAVEQPGNAVTALGELMEEVDVVWTVADSHVFTPQTTSALILAALRRRVPLIGLSTAHVRSGALATLYCDYEDVGRQTGEVVQRLLDGARPEDVPVAGPRKVSLALNLRTAQHLGLDVSPPLVSEALEVVR
jgi:putative tryptophan/tyrosine transport system substrate-binding protein